ncbi:MULTISPECIES: HAD family hydrolase [Caproicibacterium]|uniref:HAD family phosphatase n=1 Tax=Caproicibacterium argilliputei TaxID=3030016 RepID=A0AA97D9D7_9FIRM|nr:HAD family phosphatase [Caproicibacterium argilliputei]WOC31465.1 HAD family phosphatase [Caproicibacterium argilliputei]
MAVKNIVFDMGRVLIDYCPEQYTAAFLGESADAGDCRQITDVLFGGETWQQLDAGQITETQALAEMLAQLPERLRKSARLLFYGWHTYLRPIPETNDLAFALHRAGYGIYVLSNTGVRLHVYSHRIPAFSILDGAVYSADVQQVKPDAAIFHTLLSRYSLQPQECFFIDDNEANVAAAEKLGLQTHLYETGFDALTQDLHHAGVHWQTKSLAADSL